MSAEPIGNGDGQELGRRPPSRPPRRQGTRHRKTRTPGGAGPPGGRDGHISGRPTATASVVVEAPPVVDASAGVDASHVLVSGDSFVGLPIGGRKPRDLVEPSRVRLRLARVGPLSVLSLSLLFGALAMAGLVAGLAMLYALLQATGVLHSIEKLVNTSGVGHHFHFNGGWIFTRVAWVAAGAVVVGSIVAVCLAVLYNSLADLTGGLDLTFDEHPRTVVTANETPTWVTRFRGMRLWREDRAITDGQGNGGSEPPPT
jgi:Transmembrane domain of unknown function (DUF3566)